MAVEKLYLDHNLITSIPVGPLTNHSRLTYLDLRNNLISNIEPNAFERCGQLKQLYLVTNSFTSIATGAFNGASSLTYLSLSANRLTTIPPVAPLVSLETLALEGNRIRDLRFSNDFLSLRNLGSIVLSNNPIGKLLNDTFSNLKNCPVKKLEIARSNIAKVGLETFKPLKKIISLKIGYNPLNEWQIVNVMSGLQNSSINSLDIRNISLEGRLPTRTFSFMRNIEHLTLRNNRIMKIQEKAFLDLPRLILIDLTSCNINQIDPDAFFNLTNLQLLFLTDNHLATVPKGLPPTLQKLYIEKNQLSTIKNDDFLNLTDLEELYLTSNQIHALEGHAFAGLNRLSKLHLDQNRIGTLPGKVFGPLVRLVSLSLNKNNLQSIQDHAGTFSSLVSLVFLGLSDNQCSKIPMDLFHPLKSLAFLEISNNSFGVIIKNDGAGELFAGLTKLERLDMNNNQISTIHDSLFRDLSSLKNLSLARNQISHWGRHLFSSTKSLGRLDLSYNLITLINETSLVDLKELKVFDLRKSPFACTCDTRWFRNWVNTTSVRLLGVNMWTCASPASWQGTRLLDFDESKIDCTDYTLYYILGGAAGGMIFVVLIVTVWYRKRYFMAYRLYRAVKYVKGEKRTVEGYAPLAGEDKAFDIFLSYSPKDLQWVRDKLLPNMDNGQVNNVKFDGRYKVCFGEREFDPSRSVVSNIDQHLASSHYALIILSKHYGQDRRCEFELDCILHAAAEGQIDSYHVVILGNLPAKYISKGLAKDIEQHRFIEFPNVNTAEQDFFERINDKFDGRNGRGNIIP
ncbi:hypothetical protein LOTGIDRAFT_163508 [Lottia gigantea]|uniref:TIR domain-containing protein n=1 Tax=Lottia gigantea TaxID=225164 RepID=V4ACG6_LOTGI|nr:hypothetical protein LOTGIDRAFT_163508 [Lottia gigantea]ESO90996.1 hypothetical protein LOTGIDRAFT_163508 [Lottia gigantea]